MPVINIVLEDLNRMLKDKLSSTDFANIIPKIGADPDEINDSEAIVEFFPDRPDLLSTEGVARALRSFTEQSLGLIEYEVKPQTTHMFISKEVMEIRPCISGGIFFFQAEDGIRDVERSRGLGDVYKRQGIPS